MVQKNLLLASLILFLSATLTACGSAGTANNKTGIPDTTIGNPTIPNPNPSGNPVIPNPGNGDQSTSKQQDPNSSIGDNFFFSYDESGSTASRDLTFSALKAGAPLQPSWGRPYEYLNAEEFDHFDLTIAEPFNVSMGLYRARFQEIPVSKTYTGYIYALGINLTGPILTKAERDNVVLTLLVDISGSMEADYSHYIKDPEVSTRLDVVKHGLTQLMDSLKEGDILNLVTFDTNANSIITDWHFNSEDNRFMNAVLDLKTRGSTNLNAGVELAYQEANRTFDEEKSNRVIILTDANANTGVIDPDIIANHTTVNGLEGIYFSGVGIGEDFNDTLLNQVTDIGKGTYSAMITPSDSDRIFNKHFMRFIEPALSNVKFQLTYPDALKQFYSAAEDISADPAKVSTVNFSYNAEQFFLELFNSPNLLSQELTITFTTYYGDEQQITITKTLGELLQKGEEEIKSAAAVTTLAQLVAGSLTCNEVLSSDLYNQDIRTFAFEKYKQGIDDYCMR